MLNVSSVFPIYLKFDGFSLSYKFYLLLISNFFSKSNIHSLFFFSHSVELESEMNHQVSTASIGNLSRATGHLCIESTSNTHFTQMELIYFPQHFKTGPDTSFHPIYSLTCNIIFTPGSNRNVSYKCQWIIYYGKLIRYINAFLHGVGEKETVNASWINLMLLAFEVFTFQIIITRLHDFTCRLHLLFQSCEAFFIQIHKVK